MSCLRRFWIRRALLCKPFSFKSGYFSACELLSLRQNQNGGSSNVGTVVITLMAIDCGRWLPHPVTGSCNHIYNGWYHISQKPKLSTQTLYPWLAYPNFRGFVDVDYLLTWSSSSFETHMASVKVRHWFYRVLDVPDEPMSSCFPSYLTPLSSSMFLFGLSLFLRPSRVYLRATHRSAAGCMRTTWTIRSP